MEMLFMVTRLLDFSASLPRCVGVRSWHSDTAPRWPHMIGGGEQNPDSGVGDEGERFGVRLRHASHYWSRGLWWGKRNRRTHRGAGKVGKVKDSQPRGREWWGPAADKVMYNRPKWQSGREQRRAFLPSRHTLNMPSAWNLNRWWLFLSVYLY